MTSVYVVVLVAISLAYCTILICDDALCIASSIHCCSSMVGVVIFSYSGGGSS